MKIYIYVCFLIMALFVSCMEDKGNYDYVPVNQIQIDTIHDCTIEIYDTLRIPTKVTCTLDPTTELSYFWYKYRENDGTKMDTISFDKDLEYKVSDLVGKYQIFLKVTDMNTGISDKTSFNMTVVGKFGAGLMILGEVDGKTSFVFINDAGNVTDVYGDVTGDQLGKNPVFIADATSPNISSLKDIMVLCADERGGTILSNADFTLSKELKDIFFIQPSTFSPQAYYRAFNPIYATGFADFIISNGKLHTRTLYHEEELGRTIAFNPAIEGKYELCPHAIVCPAAYLFYDNAGEGRFLSVKQGTFSMNNVFNILKSGTEGFDPTKLGMKCIYLSEAAQYTKKQSGFGIFKDNASGQLQGVRFSMDYYSNDRGDYPMALYAKTPITADAKGIENATGYAMSLARPHLYYSKDNQVYFYGIDNNQAYPVYDVDTVPGLENSVIDKIYMEYRTMGYSERNVYGSTSDTYNKVLYVSSHKEGQSGKNGTIHILKLADNGTVESRTALYKNICGKTVSICYKR